MDRNLALIAAHTLAVLICGANIFWGKPIVLGVWCIILNDYLFASNLYYLLKCVKKERRNKNENENNRLD